MRDREPPGERGNVHADNVIGSGQKTATGPGENGIDPRIETGLPENENESARGATARGTTATERMAASDALDREREEERERG